MLLPIRHPKKVFFANYQLITCFLNDCFHYNCLTPLRSYKSCYSLQHLGYTDLCRVVRGFCLESGTYKVSGNHAYIWMQRINMKNVRCFFGMWEVGSVRSIKHNLFTLEHIFHNKLHYVVNPVVNPVPSELATSNHHSVAAILN